MKCIERPRIGGKTTLLIQHVVDWLAENESGMAVVVGGPDRRASRLLAEAFIEMPDVSIVVPGRLEQTLRGYGAGSAIFVDNFDLLSADDQRTIEHASAFLPVVVTVNV